MKKLLYVNGNPNFKETSYSRQVGDYFVENYIDKSKETEVITFNVYEEFDDVTPKWAMKEFSKDKNGIPHSSPNSDPTTL